MYQNFDFFTFRLDYPRFSEFRQNILQGVTTWLAVRLMEKNSSVHSFQVCYFKLYIL